MSSDVATIEGNADLNEAIELMERRHVKRLPVVQGGKMVGIVARSDIVRALANCIRKIAEEKPTTDAAIKRDIEAELQAQPWAPIATLEIQVEDGKVFIRLERRAYAEGCSRCRRKRQWRRRRSGFHDPYRALSDDAFPVAAPTAPVWRATSPRGPNHPSPSPVRTFTKTRHGDQLGEHREFSPYRR